MGIQVDQSNARFVLGDYLRAAERDVQGAGKNAAIVVNGEKVGVSQSDKPGFLGALFRSKADVQANKETRATFLTGLKLMLNVGSNEELETKLGKDVLKLSDFTDNKGRPLSAFRVKTILNKVKDIRAEEKRAGKTAEPPKPQVSEQPKTETKDTTRTTSHDHGPQGAQEGAHKPAIKHVPLSPDYDLGFGERDPNEPITEIHNWQNKASEAFIDDAKNAISGNSFEPGQAIVESFDKFGQFFERPHNVKGFADETPQTIAKYNNKLLAELQSNLKLYNDPKVALMLTASKADNLHNSYGEFMAEVLRSLRRAL